VPDQSIFLAFHFRLFLGGLVLPALTCGCVLALWRPRFKPARPGVADGAAALALGSAYLIGHVVLLGRPSLPPLEAESWLWYVAGATALAGLAGARHRLILLVTYSALWLIAVWLLSRPMIANEWDRAEAARWLIGLGAGGLLYEASLEWLSRSREGPLALPLFVATVGAAVLLFWSHTAKLAQQAGILAAALLPFCIWPFGRPVTALPSSAVAIVGLLLPGFLLAGSLYSARTPPTGSIALILTAPFAAALGCLPGPRWLPRCLSGVAAAGLVAAALILASRTAPEEEEDVYLRVSDVMVSARPCR
jgi:hypothetical protein